jgi:hypothetical protein
VAVFYVSVSMGYDINHRMIYGLYQSSVKAIGDLVSLLL